MTETTHKDHATEVLYPAIERAMQELQTLHPGFNEAVNRAFNHLHDAFWSECPVPASAAPKRPEVISCTCGLNDACRHCPPIAHMTAPSVGVQTKQHEGLTFGDALVMLKAGQRVARAGWNGKGMWLSLSCAGTREVPAAGFWSPHNRQHAEEQGGHAKVLPSITMKTATGEILMGWLASQTDMLAEDWQVVAEARKPYSISDICSYETGSYGQEWTVNFTDGTSIKVEVPMSLDKLRDNGSILKMCVGRHNEATGGKSA